MEPVIPTINEEICFSVEKDMLDEKYLTNMAKHIAKYNPTIAGFIHSFSGRLSPCCKKAAMLAAFTTYRLIESQMEANKMKTDLKI
jgi:hypothetical protein